MAKKYIKNEKGTVKSITTDNLQLEKPLLNENYDIEVHNRNMDKIDNAIQEVKGQVSGLELKAEKVTLADTSNKFEATNVEDALLENKTSILSNNSQIKALSSEVSYNKNSISEIQGTINNLNQEITGQRVKAIQLNNELIDIL